MQILRSAREIGMMRKAGLLVWEAHRLAASMLAPGVTTGEIDAAVEEFFKRQDARPLFKGVPGRVPFPAVTCMSINEEVVHGIPGPRRLLAGDIVSIDTGCKLKGWCGDAAVTYPIGQIAPEVQRLLDVTSGVLDLCIDLMGRCSMWSQVAAEMEAYVRGHGFAVVEAFVGHGIGRQMHEEPPVPNFGLPDQGPILRKGMVLAIEPMVTAGDWRTKKDSDGWTVRTLDGSLAAHFEHTIAIADGEAQVLTLP